MIFKQFAYVRFYNQSFLLCLAQSLIDLFNLTLNQIGWRIGFPLVIQISTWNIQCTICIVLKSDQWKLVTTSDPLKAIVIPMSEAKRVTIDAFGVTSGYQFHWSRLRTIQIPLFSFLTTCEGPNCSSWMQPFDLTSFFVDFS